MHNNNRFRIRKEGRANDIRYIVTFIRSCWCWHIPFQQMFSSLNTYCIHIFFMFSIPFWIPFSLCDTKHSKCMPNTKKIEAEIRYGTAKEFASDIRFGHVFRLFWNWTCPHNHIKLNGTRKAHLGDGFCFCIVVPFPFVIFSFNCVCLHGK